MVLQQVRSRLKPINKLAYVLLSVYCCSFSVKASLFNEYQIVLPFNLTQPVVAANILSNPGNELLMLGVDETGQRQLAIYALDNNSKFQLMDQMLLEQTLFAFDVGDVQADGLQNLYFLSKEQLFQYQFIGPGQTANKTSGPVMAAPQTNNIPSIKNSQSTLVPISKITSMFLSAQADAIVAMDFAKDINNDQFDDFVIPHFEQLNLYLSSEQAGAKGGLTAQALDITSLLKVDGSEMIFQPRELFFVDMDLNTSTDIVLVETAQLRVFQQSANGQFNSTPIIIPLAADIEGINWWNKIEADGQQLDQSQLKHRKVEAITDINGDKLPDLIVRFTQSSGVLDRTNDYEFFYGRAKQGRLNYGQDADTRIQSESTLSDLKWLDLDGDGKQEIMLSAFDLGVSQIISALLSSSIEQEVLIFKMDENNRFSAKPTASQDVEITFSLSSGRSGEPMMKAQDVNGDKLKDLIFSEGEEQIRVLFASDDGKKLFNKRAEKYKVRVPKNAKSITHNDVNNDGKMDLILHYSRADSAELLNKIIVLIAN
jgi:hypothetical protein